MILAAERREKMICALSQECMELTLRGQTVTDVMPATPPDSFSFRPMIKLRTAAALRPCPVCGSRSVAGCSCIRDSLPCEAHMGFRFACVYCDRLQRLQTED